MVIRFKFPRGMYCLVKSQKIVLYSHIFSKNQKDVSKTYDFIKLFWLYLHAQCPYQYDMSTIKERIRANQMRQIFGAKTNSKVSMPI
jgi:hypothetical protein